MASVVNAALDTVAPEHLGRGLACKTLLAVTGPVSVHDRIWTTDRAGAARRWSELHPEHEAGLARLPAWSQGHTTPDRRAVQHALEDIVQHVVATFTDVIGLWT